MNWIIERVQEKSTWAGLLGILASFGVVAISPEQKEAILTAIGAITSAVLIFMQEKKSE